MKSIFQSIASLGPWVRLLIKAGGCISITALVLLWSPWRTQEPRTAPSGQPATAEAPKPHELWTVPSEEPTTVEALKQEAADLAERTIKAFPRDPDSHALKGNVCLFNGKAVEAVKSWEKCLGLDPARPGAHDGISLVAWEQGRFEKVVSACRQALKYDINMPDVHFRLARALIELGRAEESITAAKRAITLWPRAFDAHLVLGQACIQSLEYAKARDSFLQAVEIRPGNFHAYYGLATASAKLGQPDKARQYQERFRGAMSASKADFTARTLSRTVVDDLSDQRSRTAAIYTGAAGIYRKHGNVQQAERLRQRAASIAPNTMGRR